MADPDHDRDVVRLLKPQSEDEAAAIQAFLDADATAPRSAMTAAQLGLTSDAALVSLVDRGTLRHVPGDPDRLFVPLYSRGLFMSLRQQRYMTIACACALIVVILLGVLFGSPSPRTYIARPNRTGAIVIHP